MPKESTSFKSFRVNKHKFRFDSIFSQRDHAILSVVRLTSVLRIHNLWFVVEQALYLGFFFKIFFVFTSLFFVSATCFSLVPKLRWKGCEDFTETSKQLKAPDLDPKYFFYRTQNNLEGTWKYLVNSLSSLKNSSKSCCAFLKSMICFAVLGYCLILMLVLSSVSWSPLVVILQWGFPQVGIYSFFVDKEHNVDHATVQLLNYSWTDNFVVRFGKCKRTLSFVLHIKNNKRRILQRLKGFFCSMFQKEWLVF